MAQFRQALILENCFKTMRMKGLEPSHLAVLEPKPSASTNSATSALGIMIHHSGLLAPLLGRLPGHLPGTSPEEKEKLNPFQHEDAATTASVNAEVCI